MENLIACKHQLLSISVRGVYVLCRALAYNTHMLDTSAITSYKTEIRCNNLSSMLPLRTRVFEGKGLTGIRCVKE
jgi:hypothetical protein